MVRNILVWILLTCLRLHLGEECQESQNGVLYVCKGETVCMRWEITRAEQEVTRIFVAHDYAQYIDQNWAESPLIYEPRASISWHKSIDRDRIDLQIQNTTLSDNGMYHLDMYIKNVFTPYTSTLHVLKACPDREMYQNPQIHYQFLSHDKVLVNDGVIELTEPGNVTLLITLPAADPPVLAVVMFEQSRYNYTGTTSQHSVFEVSLSINEPGEIKVGVTLTFVAWAESVSVIKTQMKLITLAVSTTPVLLLPSTIGFKTAALLDTRTILGVIVGVVFVLVLIVVAIAFACRLLGKRRIQMEQHHEAQPLEPLSRPRHGELKRNRREPYRHRTPHILQWISSSACCLSSEERLVKKYLNDLKASVTDTVNLKNKELNRPFRIKADKVFYVELVMSEEEEMFSHNSAKVEDYLKRKSQSLIKKETIAIKNMFEPVRGKKEPRRVLLMGAAGMGKTTVSQEHIRILAAEDNDTTEIQAMYHFECRRLAAHIQDNEKHSLADLFFKRHGPNISESKTETIVEHLDSIQNKVHITIDGLDELPRWDSCSNTTPEIHSMTEPAEIHVIIYSLIHKHLLPWAKVLVTSRPISSLKPLDFDKTIVALGFAEASIKECLRATCQELYEEAFAYIEMNGLLLYCMVPLTCVFLGAILRRDLSLGTRGEERFIIDSMSRLYVRVNLEYTRRRDEKQSEDIFDLNPARVSTFLKLADLAAHGLFGEDPLVVFDNKALAAVELTPNEYSFGLLEVVPEEDISDDPYMAYFMHKTVQEFFAALSVCVAWGEAEVTKLTQAGTDRLDNVRLFVAGLLGDPECQRLVKALSPETSETTLDERAESFVLALAGRASESDKDYTDRNIKAVLLTIECAKEGLMARLVPRLESDLLKDVNGYQTLDLCQIPGGLLPNQLTAIGYFLKKCDICNGLGLGGCRVGDNGAIILAKSLRERCNLQIMTLYQNEIGDVGITALAESMAGSSNVQQLWLHKNNITDDGAVALAEVVKCCPDVKKIGLANNFIGDKGAKALLEAGKTKTTMPGLVLHNNQLSEEMKEELHREFGGGLPVLDHVSITNKVL